MEFFLVPLLAIAGVTVGIYKLAGLVFHIRLAWGLLAMLVGFAWLISLVLPGMFFHSAGFVGSVGISLACAVGFAWLATAYDARTHAVQIDTVSDVAQNPADELTWKPAAETAFPVELIISETLRETVGKFDVQPEFLAVSEVAQETIAITAGRAEFAELRMQSNSLQETAAPLGVTETGLPIVPAEYYPGETISLVEAAPAMAPEEVLRAAPEMAPEEVLRAAPAMVPEEVLRAAPAMAPGETVFEAKLNEMQDQEILPLPAEQPASDSLEDLLEFAFEQRNRRNMSGALDAFRLIRLQYGDSEALPLVAAEVVSTLQSSGDYGEALSELARALQMPTVQRDKKLIQVFTQKQKYLQALQDLLREQGKPNLPFEQIPAEWSDWLEWKMSTDTSAQS